LTSACTICPIDWLACSVTPYVCGWNDVDIRSFAPSKWWSSFHHFDMNLASQSNTILSGNPCKWTTSQRYMCNGCEAFRWVFTGIRCTSDVIQQMTTHSMLKPSTLGNGPIKSIPIDCQGLTGMGRLCNSPWGQLLLSLVFWQMSQDIQNFTTRG
jgi:hypothetical protein